jgi:hypothetical protein
MWSSTSPPNAARYCQVIPIAGAESHARRSALSSDARGSRARGAKIVGSLAFAAVCLPPLIFCLALFGFLLLPLLPFIGAALAFSVGGSSSAPLQRPPKPSLQQRASAQAFEVAKAA